MLTTFIICIVSGILYNNTPNDNWATVAYISGGVAIVLALSLVVIKLIVAIKHNDTW